MPETFEQLRRKGNERLDELAKLLSKTFRPYAYDEVARYLIALWFEEDGIEETERLTDRLIEHIQS